MTTARRHLTLTRPLIVLLAALLAAALAGCGSVTDIIGDRKPPTPTRPAFSTATPGGRLSVWLVTPAGQADAPQTPGTPEPNAVPGGNPVGPAATATAAQATIVAATATAGAPITGPNYQPSECPAPGVPAPPQRPANFNDTSALIGQFLSAGGSPTVLEATLRNWSAITDRGGVVQADTDLTGDGILEVIVTVYNPAAYNADAPLNAGQMLVYGCDSGGYRLLYSTAYNATIALPQLLRVGDMNTDVRNELVYQTETCNGASCYKEAKILTWNALLGTFQELNNGQIIAINGRIGIADVEGDGVLELTAQINPPGTAQSGPPRPVVDTWDWNGTEYVLARREDRGALYRIHAIYGADDLQQAGSTRDAIFAYDAARDDENLQTWNVSGEYEALRAYAAFRIVILYASLGNGRAEDWFNTLQAENPPGSTGNGFAQMGAAFMENYRATGDAHAACAQAISAGAANTLSVMNRYGTNNRTYTPTDLCPL
ncbi:hypothetical protein [Aggregatilinea lenta]|uniref:hypothetical protein n=1 Tax=Aggregatilinea lenta TaxID=913108 RepID=UPI0013C2FCD2|nr:hypothetical protein [Aggregatilinea lenta]